MAERSYNGRVIFQDGADEAVGEISPSVGNWIEADTYKVFFSRTNSSTLETAKFTDLASGRWIRVTGSNAADDGNNRGGRISSLPIAQGSSGSFNVAISASDVATYGIPIVPGRTYTFSYEGYFTNDIVTSGAGRNTSSRIRQWKNNGTLDTGVSYAPTTWSNTDKNIIKSYSTTFTAVAGATHAMFVMEVSEIGAGNLTNEAYFRNIQLTEVLPARLPISIPRTTATNRVAVRDMGTALRFDGVDDSVTAPFTATPLSNNATISAWFQTVGTTGANQCIVLYSPVDTFRWVINLGSDLTLRSCFNNNTTNFGSRSSVRLQPNTWYQATYTFDGTIGNLYINGVTNHAGTTAGATSGNVGLRIGRRSADQYFRGTIDEPRIWNRALSAQEVANLYFHNIVPRNGLVAEYLFNEATGTTALDTSGNGNHGTITGATYTLDTPLKPRINV
jgi:hypothetical protein